MGGRERDPRLGTGPKRGGRMRLRVLLVVGILFVGAAWDKVEDAKDEDIFMDPPSDDLLSRLGLTIWRTLESWVGRRLLRLVAVIIIVILCVVSSLISFVLVLVGAILRYLLITCSIPGERLVRLAVLDPIEVQRVLLWALVAVVASWCFSWLRRQLLRLRALLVPSLRWIKLFCILGAFIHVAACRESPTAQVGVLLGLWVLCTLLGRLVGHPKPNPQLDVAIRVLEWKVEELRRRVGWMEGREYD